MIKNILITGGSGLVGSRLTELLLAQDYNVSHLSRSPENHKDSPVKTYQWDIEKQTIDDEALKDVDCIVHLAGAGVADKRWTSSRKKLLLESRTKSAQLLINKLKEIDHKPKLFLSASAIGYYGARGDQWVDEESIPNSDFLAELCVEWEKASKSVSELEIPFNIVRIGLVLSENGGALKEIAKSLDFGIAGYLGSGDQYMSWVHIDDLCGIFMHCIMGEVEQNEVYNGVAPTPEKNIDFTRILSKVVGKGILLPVPSFVLKLMTGEMSEMLLTGQRVKSEKIEKAGYQFKFSDLKSALKDLYNK